jgi:signal peptidase I
VADSPAQPRSVDPRLPSSTSKAVRAAVEIPLLLALAVLIAFLLKTFVAQPFYIPSASMEPQLAAGDRVAVSKLSYRLHDPRRGDVVVFDSPEPLPPEDVSLPIRFGRGVLEAIGLRQPSTEEFIKRVVGLPGEVVEGREGRVFVDDRALVEPYLPPGTATSDFGPVAVPEGRVWVMGDNRRNSRDSRAFGAVDADTVVGRAFSRIWPPGRVAFL